MTIPERMVKPKRKGRPFHRMPWPKPGAPDARILIAEPWEGQPSPAPDPAAVPWPVHVWLQSLEFDFATWLLPDHDHADWLAATPCERAHRRALKDMRP